MSITVENYSKNADIDSIANTADDSKANELRQITQSLAH